MIILGIDPGIGKTGYAVIEVLGGNYRALDYGLIKPRKSLSLTQKLVFISTNVFDLAKKYNPHIAAVENVFAAKSIKSALILGQARSAALIGVGRASLDVLEISPTRVKSVVAGNGRASKEQVAKSLSLSFNLNNLKAGDEADAMAIGICASYEFKLRDFSNLSNKKRKKSPREAWNKELEKHF